MIFNKINSNFLSGKRRKIQGTWYTSTFGTLTTNPFTSIITSFVLNNWSMSGTSSTGQGRLFTTFDKGITYQTLTPQSTTSPFTCIAPLYGYSVASTVNGIIASTPDGNWGANDYIVDTQLSGSTINRLCIDRLYSTRCWATSTNGRVLYSSNSGQNFTLYDIGFGSSNVREVSPRSNSTHMIIVGDHGKVAYGNDMNNMSLALDSTFGTTEILTASASEYAYVIAGRQGKMAYSTNGADWTPINSPFGSSDTIFDVFYGGEFTYNRSNGMWMAVGSGGKLAYSEDGYTWTLHGSIFIEEQHRINYNFMQGFWVTAGNNGSVAVMQMM